MSESTLEAISNEAPGAHQVLRIAAAMVLNEAGELLLVRKQGSRYFMQPGGKIEPNEPTETALCRELEEELGLQVDPTRLAVLERVQAVAANEMNTVIDAALFSLILAERVEAAAEIAEARWVSPAQAKTMALAPLTRDYVVGWAEVFFHERAGAADTNV